MQNHKDNYVLLDENAVMKLAVLSVIGGREDQQDSAGYEIKNTEGIVAICDGMGGHEGGKTASTLAVDTLLSSYEEEYPCADLREWLADALATADAKIAALKKEDGSPLQGGSTAIVIALRNDSLYWASVGDSRIYILRDEEFVQVTRDQIYQYVLDDRLDTGQITQEEYDRQIVQGEALVSFLGIGGIPYMDINEEAFPVRSGDKIVMMSDGMYKILADHEISSVINNFTNIEEALHALEYKTEKFAKKNKRSRDNMTVAIIQIK